MPDLEALEYMLENYLDYIVALDFEHNKIHEGKRFSISGIETVALDNTFIIGIQVPSTAFPNIVFSVHASSQTEARLYEGSTFSGGGALTPTDNNRITANTSKITFVSNPTVSVNGTILHTEGAGKAGTTPSAGDFTGTAERRQEYVLNLSTDYIFEITSRDDSNIISYELSWYEVDV